MRVFFTYSKNPNWASRLISTVDKGPWTHCGIFLESAIWGDELVIHSSWNQGANIMPASIAIGSKMVQTFECDAPISWDVCKEFLKKHSGFQSYGFLQNLAIFLKNFMKEPDWYGKGVNCSELVIRCLQRSGALPGLDPDRVGPNALFYIMTTSNYFRRIK